MARFKIQSKDGSAIRYEGKPRYIGTYLKPSYLEFSEIASPTPIAWEVGDYVDYPRTGMRYYLYSLPQASKNARKGSHGRAFTYSNVQLHAATKELEIAPFRDLVPNDNGIHFSTAPDVVTFEDVYSIARRIQACMDDLYPSRWEIRVAEFDSEADAEVVQNITTAKDFALSGGTCLDALSKIYELWQDIGWIHTHEDGVEVITIGYANKRIDENTSEPYLYGKGLGLTAIKKNQTNKDEFATRLYVYGSERNLPSRYYNGLDILNAESVDIRNLMLPLDKWGQTDGLPDARKAYLENAEAVAKFGVVPRTHYFDSEDAGADIYPSVKRMTIGRIRAFLNELNQVAYYPNLSIYPNADERVDQILVGSSVEDDGKMRPQGKAYEVSESVEIASGNETISIPANSTKPIYFPIVTLANIDLETNKRGEITIKPKAAKFEVFVENASNVQIRFSLSTRYSFVEKRVEAIRSETKENAWDFSLPQMKIGRAKDSYDSIPVVLTMIVTVVPESGKQRTSSLVLPNASIEVGFNQSLAKTFDISLKQLGFDINERASAGAGKTIALNTGMCAGRSFEISNCIYDPKTDSWLLTCKRQQDDTLGILFPNNEYQIAKDDVFVLTDIAMPELYIRAAMDDVYEEGMNLLAKASRIQNHYEPSIDAKVMIESGRTLREGMFMEISDEDIVDNATDYILIDTLSIYEDESAIPTYKVTLKERRKVTYKGTPSAVSSTSTKAVEDTTEEVDLTGYATEDFVNDADSKIIERLKEVESWFRKDGETLFTTFNLASEGEVSAGGVGSGTSGGGGGNSYELLERWIDYNAAVAQALGANLGLELHNRVTAIENGSTVPDLSSYATKTYVGDEIKKVIGTAPENLDTLQEIAAVLQNNINNIGDIIEAISYKADKTELTPLQTAINENLSAINALRASYNSLLSHVNSEIARVEKAIGVVDARVTTEVSKLDESDRLIKADVQQNKEDIAEVAELADGLREDVAYAKNTVDELKEVDKDLDSRLKKVEKMWKEDEDGNIWTDRNVYSLQEVSAGGVGSGTSSGGGGGLGSIEGAVDTEILNPKDNDRLVYDKDVEKWVNKQVMVHKQVNTASKVWTVEHNLGKIPNVKVIDSNGELVYGDVYHVDMNNVRIEFGGAFVGDVYLD